MRIGFVGPVPPIRSGIAQHGRRVVEALEAAGHEVQVETWRDQYPTLLIRRTQSDVGPPPPGVSRRLRWWNPFGWWSAGRRLRGSDLLVFTWVTPFHALAQRTIMRAARTTNVAVVHNVQPHEHLPFTKPLTRLGLGHVDRAVVHSATVASELQDLGIRVETAVVPHPPNLEVEAEPPPPRAPLRLLSLGLVRPYKGVDLAIGAIDRCRRDGMDVVLTVAGEPWDGAEELAELVDELGLGDSVTLDLRWIPDAEVAKLLLSHHAVVASYRTASQSGVIPLAAAAGRPVVVTPVGGLVEAVHDGVDGTIADSVSSEGVATAIGRLHDDYDRLLDGSQRPRWSWSDVAEAITA